MNPVTERVAKAIYENGPAFHRDDIPEWGDLPEDRKEGWRSDAVIAVAIVAEEAARLADMRDHDKPDNYRFSRDRIAIVMRGIPNDPPNEYSANK